MQKLPILLVLLAGCAADPVEVVDKEPEEVLPPAPVLVEVTRSDAVDWEGHTKEGYWICESPDTTGSCMAGQQIEPDGEYTTSIEVVNLTAIHLNITWTPQDPTQTGLVFALYSGSGATLASAAGESPLSIDLELELMQGDLILMAWPQGKTATSPSVFVDATRQPFAVSGTLVSTDEVWITPAAA